MPFFTVFIAPILALYIKYRVVQMAIKITLFIAIFTSFKIGVQWAVDSVFAKMNNIVLPCTIAYIIDHLDVMNMINFALSFFASVYISRFFYNSVTKLI